MRVSAFFGVSLAMSISTISVAQISTGNEPGAWKWAIFQNNTNKIESWINQECGPKDISGLHGSIMTDEKKDYLIYIWCRADKASNWKIELLDRRATGFEGSIVDKIRLGDAVLLGIIHGVGSDTTLIARKM